MGSWEDWRRRYRAKITGDETCLGVLRSASLALIVCMSCGKEIPDVRKQ